MKQITTFEGWLDYSPGWEFDMPVYMVKPIGGYAEAGNDGGIENLIEDYFIDLFMDEDENGKAIGEVNNYFEECEPEEKKYVKTIFSKAKNNKARKGVYYWKRVIEWDDENIEYEKTLEDIKIGKE